jgi:hypothetical protein
MFKSDSPKQVEKMKGSSVAPYGGARLFSMQFRKIFGLFRSLQENRVSSGDLRKLLQTVFL